MLIFQSHLREMIQHMQPHFKRGCKKVSTSVFCVALKKATLTHLYLYCVKMVNPYTAHSTKLVLHDSASTDAFFQTINALR